MGWNIAFIVCCKHKYCCLTIWTILDEIWYKYSINCRLGLCFLMVFEVGILRTIKSRFQSDYHSIWLKLNSTKKAVIKPETIYFLILSRSVRGGWCGRHKQQCNNCWNIQRILYSSRHGLEHCKFWNLFGCNAANNNVGKTWWMEQPIWFSGCNVTTFQ